MSRLPALSLVLMAIVPGPALAQGAQDQKQEIEALEKEIESLRRQVAELRMQLGGGVDVAALRARVQARAATYRVFQATPLPPAPGPATLPVQAGSRPTGAPDRTQPDTDLIPMNPGKTGGRLLGDAEKTGLPPGTLFTVDGSPVGKQEFDDLVGYLKSYARGKTEIELKQQAMLQLIRVHAVEAAMGPRATQLRQKILDARKRIVEEKKDFDAVARELSDDPMTKDKGGDVGFFQRDGMELPFAKAAFEAQNLGEVIGPISTIYGYHLLKVTGRTPGNERWQDSVRASQIVAIFASKTQVMSFVARADAGNVDLGFVEGSYRDFAPEAFRK